jgi:hypothetical protein
MIERTPPKGGKPRAKKHLAATGLRLPLEDLARIRADAEAGGITVSECIRRRYFGVKIAARADLRAVSELRRVAGLLKHIAAEHGPSAETRAAIDATREAIERIAAPS